MRDAAAAFMDDLKRVWPNLDKAQTAAQAKLRDAGKAAAHRLVSTRRLTDIQTIKLTHSLYVGREALQTLTLQGLPWAYSRACRYCKSRDDAIDFAYDVAHRCAEAFNPDRGCLSTLVSKVVFTSAQRRFTGTLQSRLDASQRAPLDGNYDPSERDRGHTRAVRDEKRRQLFLDALAQIHPRHAEVLRMRAAGMTFHEIGALMNCSKERIRQVESKAIERIRRLARRQLEEVA